MTESMDEIEREEQRYELYQLCGTKAATDPGYAIAFVLFDIVRQLAELKQTLKSINTGIGGMSFELHDRAQGDDNDP